ncbi:MAG: OsmC family protein, partial [Gaiellaceae bacterium]
VDRGLRLSAEGCTAAQLDETWAPDHLLLAALARCTIQSLRYHAQRAGADAVASASASGTVTKRDADGRYAFVEVECAIDAEVDPPPPADDAGALLAKAERDCFVGASLTVKPVYRWRVNGEEVSVPAEPS